MTAETSSKLQWHARLSFLTLLIGFALLIMMIVVEDEFGALPLGLIVVGAAWHLVTRRRIKSAATSA
jgi:hypothetical protein